MPAQRRSTRTLWTSISIAVMITASACGDRRDREDNAAQPPEPPAASLEEAREAYAAAAEKALASATPLTDQAQLATRLNLSPERIRSFQNTSARPNVGGTLRLSYDCVENDYCICYGDADCNDMFSGPCRDPSTGGRCYTNGDRVICTCIPKTQS